MLRFLTLAFVVLANVAAADITGRIHVVDGDTFRIAGQNVRLHGIDAPEVDQTCQRPSGSDWACGKWVKKQVKIRYQNRKARCDVLDHDRYDRPVVRCYVDSRDVAQQIVQSGLAFAYRRYSMAYDLDEKRAAIRDLGLHASKVQSPSDFRRAKLSAKQPEPTGPCKIKGNISARGVKIYHMPGQEHYERTAINPDKGERYFCTARAARAAGWRPARR